MFRLRLLDGEPERFPAGMVITVAAVCDASGHVVARCNSEAEAKRIAAELERRFPDKTFYPTRG